MSWQFTHCLLVLNIIPLCGFSTVYLCIHLWKDILCVCITHSVLYDSLWTHGLHFSCDAWVSHCSGFSCRSQALEHRFSSCGPQDQGFPGGASGKERAYQCRRGKRHRLNPLVVKMPWRRAWQPTPCSCLENPMDGGA